jgi:hypothetical protein
MNDQPHRGRDLSEKHKDLLRVRIIGPEGQEWYQDAAAVPRVGEEVTIWKASGELAWSGIVSSVHWAAAETAGGLVAIVRLVEG